MESQSYETHTLRKKQSASELPRSNVVLHDVLGLDINRRSNMSFIEADRIVYAAGNCVVFQNILTKQKEYLFGLEENGVGCVAVHPTRNYIAVGACGFNPKIYIYTYPELRIVKTLAGGAERGYASLNFSQSGGKLASVAIAPDYYLTVWDWELERIGLHSKAFGQDVFTINFSLDDERRLTSCGVGHIRFWKMAATFTGLKLQGFIGKFGKVELSDIVAFKELPDGKVLSGTEVGALLLWEGNFIKCRFTAVGGTLCHQGEITYVDYDRADNIVITCGKDGYVRFWDFEAIDAAEVDADISMDFELFPVAEYRLCEEGVGIHTMLDSGNQNGIRYLVVLDTFGRLVVHNVDVGKAHMFIDDDKETDEGKEGENKDGSEQEDSLPKVSKLYSIVHHFNHQGSFVYSAVTHKHMITSSTIGQFHYGKINAMDVSPCSYLAATVGQDGSVRCWNYASREMLGVVFNDKPATSVQWLPPLLDPTSRSFAVGFQDGVVRVYTLIGNSAVAEGVDVNDLDEAGHPIVKTVLCRKMVFKPHNGAILDMHFSIDGSKLATSGGDGIVFFFRCAGVDQNDPWVPLRFVTVARLYSNMDFDGTVLQIQTESEEAKRCRTMELNANNCLTCTHLNWQMNATLCNKILFSCSDGIIRELDATPLFTTVEDSDVQHAEAEGGILDEHHHADPLHDLSLETFEYFDIPCRVAEFILPLSEVQNQLTIANSLAALNNTTKEVVVETKEKKEEGDKEEGTVVAAKKESAPPAPKIISTRVNFCNYQYHSAAENKGDIYVSGTVTVNMNMTPKDTPITLPFVANYSWSDASCDHVTCYRSGVYTWDGKEALRQPVITNIQYSKAKHFMCMGASDGSMSLRPSSYPETFIRIQGHTGSVTGTGFSFDENFCLSAGADGGLMIYRVQRHEILKTCEGLGKDIAAGVYPVSVIYKDTTVTQLKEEEVEYQKYVIASAKADDNLAHEHGFDSIDCYVSTASEKPTSVDFSQVEDLHSQKAGVFDTPVPVEGNVTSEKVNADEPSTEVAVVEEKTGEESKDGKPSVEENEISSEMAMKPVQTSVATVTASRVSPIKAILMGVGEVEDIAENAYSIQDAKLKLEEDARRLEAEEKKNKIRAQVRQLQEDFEFIISQNNEMPESVRVPPEKLVVDHAFIRMLETEGENMVEEVHKECAYETEKAEALRRKLMHRLMNGLLVEEMPLYGFDKQSQNVVYSIRTRGTDSELREILNSVHAQVRAEELEEAKSKATTAAQRNASAAMNEMYGRMQKKEEAKSSEIISSGAGAGTSASARRELRRIRKAKLAEHASKRPNENEDDVRDVKAIEEAERTIGNYKLKCADDYEVPENQRTNVEKKRKQMAMLEESMVSMRLRFNERFLAMRELKRQMVATICRDNERVREINEELVASRALRLDSSTSGRLTPQRGVPNDAVDDRSSSSPLTQQPSEVSEWVKDPVEDPFLSPSEFKDDRDEVCAEELNEFKTRREKATWVDVYPPHNHVFTGAKTSIVTNYHTGRYVAEQKNVENIEFSNSLSQPEDYFPVVPEEPKPYGVNDTVLNSFSALQDVHTMKQMSKLDSFVPVLSIARRAKKSLLQKPNTKALNDSKMRRRRMLLFERKMLEKKTKDNIRGFEEALDELRIDRHTIAADLKLAELKLLVLYQEYKLLETFEAKDTTLQQKQQRCLKEKAEILASTTESQGKLQAKQEEFKQWDDKVAMVVSEFKQHVPESHAYCEILTKIFRKKVKRSKKTGDDDDDEFEEEEEDDEDDDDDDDDEVEDACPSGCDIGIYEHVIDLRERRADAEDVCNDISKTTDEFKKTIERLKQREKQIDKDAKQTEAEIQQFQLQKQSSLNTIDVVVPVSVSQLYVFENSGMFTGPEGPGAGAVTEDEGENSEANAAKLKNCGERTAVESMDIKSYVLFSEKALRQLQNRIGGLVSEIHDSKMHFKELHRERVKLEKARDVVKESIEGLTEKCSNLQMLKFGKLMDIDQLEAGNDKTKENEAQEGVKAVEEKHSKEVHSLTKEMEYLRNDLAGTTKRSTSLLSEVAMLTEAKQSISKELDATSGVVASQDAKSTQHREIEERNRIAQYVTLQSREIEALKMELIMLKRKEAPQMMPYAGQSNTQGSAHSNTGGMSNSSILPPINPR